MSTGASQHRDSSTHASLGSNEDMLRQVAEAAGFRRLPGEDDESFYGRLLQGIREQRAEYIVSTNVKKTKIGALAFEMWWADRPKVVAN